MIYALTGYKQSGKSTAAKYIEEKTGAVRHNFKDGLVQEIKDNFPDLLRAIVWQQVADCKDVGEYPIEQLFKEKPPLMRALMQNYGTDVRRKDNPDYWTQKWFDVVNQLNNVVTDDVRFINEAKAIKFLQGTIIRIVRTDIKTGGQHVSETEQDSIVADYTIEVEEGEHDKLYAELDKIISATITEWN